MPRHAASFPAVPLLVLSLLVCGASSADATPYDITFTPSGRVTTGFSASGSFDYTAASDFSNFRITVSGVTIDLTSAANNPTSGAYPTDCPSNGLTGAAYSFEILTKCNTGSFAFGQPGVGAMFYYNDMNSRSQLLVGFGGKAPGVSFQSVFDATEVPHNLSTFLQYASFQVNAVPEPASAILLATGVLGLAGLRRRR